MCTRDAAAFEAVSLRKFDRTKWKLRLSRSRAMSVERPGRMSRPPHMMRKFWIRVWIIPCPRSCSRQSSYASVIDGPANGFAANVSSMSFVFSFWRWDLGWRALFWWSLDIVSFFCYRFGGEIRNLATAITSWHAHAPHMHRLNLMSHLDGPVPECQFFRRILHSEGLSSRDHAKIFVSSETVA